MEATQRVPDNRSANTSIGNLITTNNLLDSSNNIQRGSQKKTSIMMPKPEVAGKLAENGSSGGEKKQDKKEDQKDRGNSVSKQKEVNNKPSTGGVLKGGNAQSSQSKNESLVVDQNQQYGIGLQDVVSAILKVQKLNEKQVLKLVNNFTPFACPSEKPSNQQDPYSALSTITKKITQKNKQGVEITLHQLNFIQIQQIQLHQRLIINQFWISIIRSICSKKRYISPKNCLQIIKYHIKKNKQIYLQKGSLNVKLFIQAGINLCPIINDKVMINTDHPHYKQIYQQIQLLVLNLFTGLEKIFTEMGVIYQRDQKNYFLVFEKLEKDNNKKGQLIENLFKTFKHIIVNMSQRNLDQDVVFIESVAQSIVNCLKIMPESFNPDKCLDLLKFIDDNYFVFNQVYGKRDVSKAYKRLNSSIQKIILSMLLKNPFTIKKWPKDLTKFIFQSNLSCMTPFKFLLDQYQRQSVNINRIPFQTNGIYWKLLIDQIIKLNKGDKQQEQFIISSMEGILRQNSQFFWQDPSQFESFFQYTKQLIYRKKAYDKSQTLFFNQMLRLANALMGRSKSTSSEGSSNGQYSQDRKFQYSLQVYNKFPHLFMNMSKNQFLVLFAQEFETAFEENKEVESNFKQRSNLSKKILLTIKKYTLKLLLSQPEILFELKKSLKSLSHQNIINFLIFDTLNEFNFNSELFQLAFITLDSLLTCKQTSSYIIKILNLTNNQNMEKLSLYLLNMVDFIFKNSINLGSLYKHAITLIDLNYQDTEWCKVLLAGFYSKSKETKDIVFAINYSKLLANILSRLNSSTNEQRKKSLKLKPYINFDFIIEFIKFNLKVHHHKQSYLNVQLHQLKKLKTQSLLQSIRLFNIILNYFYLKQNTKRSFKGQSNTQKFMNNPQKRATSVFESNKNSYQAQLLQKSQSMFFPAYFIKQIGIKDDKQFCFQVNSQSCSTTYINALFIILLNSNSHRQKALLKQTYYDYQELIMQCIQMLIKTNPKRNPSSWFSISSLNKSSYPQYDSSIRSLDSPDSFLKQFISYIEQTMNITGLQILIFSNILQEDQKRMRSIVDKIRTKLQNKNVCERIKKQMLIKVLSTLSRYFRDTINGVQKKYAKKSMNLQTEQLFEVKAHLQFLLKVVVELAVRELVGSRQEQKSNAMTVFSNIYGGFVTLHRFDRIQFLKWCKNYSKVILSQLNFKNVRKISSIDPQNQPVGTPSTILSEQYFQLLQLFLNIWQYSPYESTQQYINSIEGFHESLTRLTLYIVQDLEYENLPDYVSQTLLQILISCVNLIIVVNNNNLRRENNVMGKNIQGYRDVLRDILQEIGNKAGRLVGSFNYAILNLVLCSQLEVENVNEHFNSGNSGSNNNNNSSFYPLQLILSKPNPSPHTIKIIIQNMKKQSSTSTNIYFVCFAKALLQIIKTTQYNDWCNSNLINQLLSLYKYYNTMSYNTAEDGNNVETILYRKIWVIELMMALFNESQKNSNMNNCRMVEKEFEKVLMDDDAILVRLGYLMQKMAMFYAEIYIEWIPSLTKGLQIQYLSSQYTNQSINLKYAQKVQLNQLLKLTGLILSSGGWNSTFTTKYEYLVDALLRYRKIFQKLLISNKNILPSTLEQIKLSQIPVARSKMNTSATRQFQRQNIALQAFRSMNQFQLMDELLSVEIVCQYSLLCVTIPYQSDHLSILKKNIKLSDPYNWDLFFITLAEVLIQKYGLIVNGKDQLKGLLGMFADRFYLSNNWNYKFSLQVLFTNSVSLSTFLNCSQGDLSSLVNETITCLLNMIVTLNQRIKSQLRKQQHQLREKVLETLIDKVDCLTMSCMIQTNRSQGRREHTDRIIVKVLTICHLKKYIMLVFTEGSTQGIMKFQNNLSQNINSTQT